MILRISFLTSSTCAWGLSAAKAVSPRFTAVYYFLNFPSDVCKICTALLFTLLLWFYIEKKSCDKMWGAQIDAHPRVSLEADQTCSGWSSHEVAGKNDEAVTCPAVKPPGELIFDLVLEDNNRCTQNTVFQDLGSSMITLWHGPFCKTSTFTVDNWRTFWW